jgi:hypothetical protein
LTPPDPAGARIPGMIDDQQRNTVFLKPLVTSPKIEIGEYTYYNDADDATAFETRNVLYTAGPERLIIGRFCAIATGARFLLSSANHPILGSTAFPFFIFGGDWLERTADLLPRIASRGDTVIGNDVWIGRDAVIMPGGTVGDRGNHRRSRRRRVRRPAVRDRRRQPGTADPAPLLRRGHRSAATDRVVELADRDDHLARPHDLGGNAGRARPGGRARRLA